MGSLKQLKRVILFAIVSAILISNVFAYPIIISESGVNHQEAKELIYSIPEEYYKYVDIIEFVNETIKKYNWISDTEAEINNYGGWYWANWDNNHNCYNGKIIIYDFDALEHELGHINSHCVLKENKVNEKFANEFKI